MDKRINNGGHKTAGRKAKNKEGVRITFTPSQEALNIYNSWDNKASNLDKAIIQQGVDNLKQFLSEVELHC